MPNYEAVTTGAMAQRSDSAASAWTPTRHLFPDQLRPGGAGRSPRAFPGPCSTVISHNDTATHGQYAMRHTPALLDHHAAVLSQMRAKRRCRTIRYQALPQFTFITPNICDDMHGLGAAHDPFANCRKGSNALERRTDSWVRNVVTRLVAAGATVFITFDESKAGNVPAVCR